MGKLYVVATPIGHLGDLSDRAREVLASVDLVAAEDTRRTGRLLAHCGIDVPMRPYHDHNEQPVTASLLEQMRQGSDIALVSDAGTPQVSDPGFNLVRDSLLAGIQVIPIPGASALTALISVSGIPNHRFTFEGFLPARTAQRDRLLVELAHEVRSMVFYEAPHRIRQSLESMTSAFGGERQAMLARELTKRHEQIVMGTLSKLTSEIKSGEIPARGEFAIMVSGAPEASQSTAEHEALMRKLLKLLAPSKAAELAADLTGQPRKAFYGLAMSIKKEN